MKYGMNLLLWSGSINEEHYPVIANIKKAGFDGVVEPAVRRGRQLPGLSHEVGRKFQGNPLAHEAPSTGCRLYTRSTPRRH